WDQEISTILVSMKVEYLEQASHPAHFDIGQRISKVGNKSFDISTSIFKEGEDTPILQAKFILVTYDYRNNRSIPVPDDFRKHLHVS
ncbi:MAG TPA: thioesterase family protein, partial [Candidatus Marinimicrobia bacterium]|nr:thioesterase family protein [Candidatus Neomarinimicrobiota bacterium]